MRRFHRYFVILSLLILAVLYIRTIKVDLPYRYNGEEDYFYTSAMKIRETGTQIQVFYPPLSPYLTSAISLVMDATSGGTQYAGNVANAAPTYFASRLSSVFFALLACCFLYRIGELLHSPAAGLAILWLFAVDSQVFIFSYTIRGDIAAYTFMSASIFFSLIALRRPKMRSAIWWASGTMLLAILSKYTVASVAVFPASLWLRRFVPSLRTQIFLIGEIVLIGIGLIVAIRVWGQPLREIFERSGFVFLFSPDLVSISKLQASLSTLQ